MMTSKSNTMRKHDECNNIGGVMISVLAASLWDRTPAGQTKSYKIDICYLGVRAKTGWLRIGIICQSGATCLPLNCCFSELAL